MNAIARTFWFRRTDIGYFSRDELPRTAGPCALNFWREEEFSKALKSDGSAVCYYYAADARVFFTVRAGAEDGVFELSDFETDPWLLPGTIAQQLGEIFQELVERRPFSAIARVALTEA